MAKKIALYINYFGNVTFIVVPLAGVAFEVYAAVMVLHGMLHYRKPQARAAGFLGAALVRTVEALEHARLILGRDADARIGDGDGGFAHSA